MILDFDLILKNFERLIKQIKIDIDNSNQRDKLRHMFRLKSIQNVIKILKKLKDSKKKSLTLEEISKIKGIGTGTINRIKEIMKTGSLSEVLITSADEAFQSILSSLEEIYGVGHLTAYNFLKKYNISSIEELKQKIALKEIEVNPIIEKGLKYVGKINTQIPHNTITLIREFLLDSLYEVNYKLFGAICGSYRRQKETSGDVDMIIIHSELLTKTDINKNKSYLELFIKKLLDKSFLIESLTAEDVETKYMGIFSYNDIIGRIDIRYIPADSYYSAILYFTGGKEFNQRMRIVAKSKGYKLNEYGLYEGSKAFVIHSEKDIFDRLGMKYIRPELR
jgi:DNA polymerase/3'-5' exonuclease PolX